jgi:hypothetical protein
MKTKLSFREIEIIIQSKSRNLTWKVIANIVAYKPETVRCAYRREMKKRLCHLKRRPVNPRLMDVYFGRKSIPNLL